MTYREFWPYYLSEHSNPWTRNLHFIGTLGVLACAALGFIRSPYWWALMPLAGYAFAWTSHFFVEKNRPATFRHPWLSLIGDFHMFGLMLTGRLAPELKKHNIGSSHGLD